MNTISWYTSLYMTLTVLMATVAVALAVIGNVPYLYKVIKGEVQPHPYTWAIWSIVSLVTVFGQIQKGAGIGAIPTAASEVFTVIIFLLSIKYGFKNIQKKDTIFLVIALLGLIPWMIFKDPTISVIVVVAIDCVAFIPTLKKTFTHPETETSILYISNVLRHILILLLIENYNIATSLHSVTMVVTNTLMTAFILRKNFSTKVSQTKE